MLKIKCRSLYISHFDCRWKQLKHTAHKNKGNLQLIHKVYAVGTEENRPAEAIPTRIHIIISKQENGK